MKTSRVFCSVVSLVLVFPLLLSGCTKSANSVSTSSKQSTSSSAKAVKLTFTYWGSTAEMNAIQASVRTFEQKYKNVVVNAIHIPNDDFLTKLNSMIAANNAPDISYSAEWKCQMGKEGLIYNFYDLMKRDSTMKKEDYLKTCWWNWSPTESAGPIMANVTTSLMYNKDMFTKADLPLPPTKVEDAWSWDQFVNVAKKLTLDTSGHNATDPKFDPNNIKQYGVEFATTWNAYMPFVYSNGGYYLSQNLKSFALNEPAAAGPIQKIADLINVYHVSPTAVQRNSMPAPATALQSKQIAMYIDGSWNHLDLSEATGLNWGVGVLPINKNYTTFFDGGSLIIFKSTKHLDETWNLYKWITDPESSKEITKMFQSIWLPVQTKYYTDPQKLNLWASETLPCRPKGFQDAVVNSTYKHQVRATEINVEGFSEMDTLVSSALDEVWAGKKTAQQALTEVKSKVDPLVKGTYFGDRS